jgi:hypothetical protein
MSRTDYRTLINRGRKAGLGTAELYSALAARRPETGDHVGESDGNGYVSDYGNNGSSRLQYHPLTRIRNG